MTSPQNGNGIQSSTNQVGPSGNLAIDSLVGGLKWGGTQGSAANLSYSFPWATTSQASWAQGGSYSSLNEPGVGSSVTESAGGFALTAAQQKTVSTVLGAWSSVANISFTPTSDTASNVGDLRFSWTHVNVSNASAWAYMPNAYYASGGDVWLSAANLSSSSSSWETGGRSFFALLHESGHSLGLKHPFEGTAVVAGIENTAEYSVMAYDDHPDATFIRITGGANSFTATTLVVEPDTPMVNDILAMQYLYGANMAYHAGDDVYTFDPATPFFRTIWDGGGNDTISVANFTKPCTIDLQQGHFSKITIESDVLPAGQTWSGAAPKATYDGTNNLAIAYGAVIENAIGGSGNDTLIGNSANNRMTGGRGDDLIDGKEGIDSAIYAGARKGYLVNHSGATWTVQDRVGTEGRDTLTNIERLVFNDGGLALDLGKNESAGKAVQMLGALYGLSSLSQPKSVGKMLDYFDSGVSLQEAGAYMVSSGTTAALAGGASNAALVQLLYKNLVEVLPSAATTASLVTYLDRGIFTQGQFVAAVAGLDFNQSHVGLVGLAETGLVFA